MTKRKIPIFKIHNAINGFEIPYDAIIEAPEIKERIINEVLVAVKTAMKEKRKSIPLMEISDTDFYVELHKNNFKNSLTNALKYYESKEDYKKCAECRDLMKTVEK